MKRDIIAEMKQDLGMTKKKRSLMEALLNDDEEFGMENSYDDAAPMPAGEEEMTDTDVTSDDEMGVGNIKDDPAFTQIRKIAITELAKMANNPTSERYELLKRIWTMIDKASEDYVNAKNGNGNMQNIK